MQILIQYWSGFEREIADKLQYYGFFPMMTMLIRPLAETLSLLPALPEAGRLISTSFGTNVILKEVQLQDHLSNWILQFHYYHSRLVQFIFGRL
jgi:hypothetical protein